MKFNDIEYELIENYKDSFDEESAKEYITDYYNDFDYILGDFFAGRVRLKGFYDNKNTKAKRINNYNYIKEYINKYCSYDCAYFILKKCKK